MRITAPAGAGLKGTHPHQGERARPSIQVAHPDEQLSIIILCSCSRLRFLLAGSKSFQLLRLAADRCTLDLQPLSIGCAGLESPPFAAAGSAFGSEVLLDFVDANDPRVSARRATVQFGPSATLRLISARPIAAATSLDFISDRFFDESSLD